MSTNEVFINEVIAQDLLDKSFLYMFNDKIFYVNTKEKHLFLDITGYLWIHKVSDLLIHHQHKKKKSNEIFSN